MLQRFLIGLRSGEDGGHTMTFSPFIPITAIDAEVLFAARARKWSVIYSTYFAEV
ncbi:unnamed protein product, partial [Staurois parvus]